MIQVRKFMKQNPKNGASLTKEQEPGVYLYFNYQPAL